MWITRVLPYWLLISILFAAPAQTSVLAAKPEQPALQVAGPTIRDVADNRVEYANGQVPTYKKLEITFQVDTSATNLQMPYDPNPPAGVQRGGISVDALFTPDNWVTVFTQPAFYFQSFTDEIKSGREWFYPTGSNAWKVRFSPNQPGSWQYKIRARDASGVSESPAVSFLAGAAATHGPIRVSKRDARYFEYSDGTYFPGLGYNMNFDDISWINPVLNNEANFSKMSQNGIQLVRLWLSQWSIWGAHWNPWQSIDPSLHGQYFPYPGLSTKSPYGTSQVSLEIESSYNPCMFLGFIQASPAVKANTNYRVRVRYRTEGINGPKTAGKPYGFTVKMGSWLWGQAGQNCMDPGTGTVLTPYQPQNTSGWQMLEGRLNSGNNDYLPYFYLVMENVNWGRAYVDYVWIEEDLGGGRYGPNIVNKPWMAHHQYFDQRNSFAFDKVVNLAEKYGVYLRPVIMEKHDWIMNRFDYQGNPIAEDQKCFDSDTTNDPPKCPGNEWFYGNWEQMSMTRWYEQAYWRYLQARWGYSNNIHSWELLNEGDPYNSQHYTLANELGKYMHQFKPDDHLVSTSFWHSFPRNEFWANPAYPAVDFADVHQYIPQGDPGFNDTAQATYGLSMWLGAKQSNGAGKPVIRGETGLVDSGSEPPSAQVEADSQGIWLHKYVWAGINSGGLLESYWYEEQHIYRTSGDTTVFDHRPVYGGYYNFIKDIPLSNGSYVDAAATSSNAYLTAWGQKDLQNGRAHLWINNTQHTWKAVVNRISIPSQSGTVRLTGFKAGGSYNLQWWDTYQVDPARQILRIDTLTAQSDGSLNITVQNLATDTAVRITPAGTVPGPAPVTPTAVPTSTTRPTLPPVKPTATPPSNRSGGFNIWLPEVINSSQQ